MTERRETLKSPNRAGPTREGAPENRNNAQGALSAQRKREGTILLIFCENAYLKEADALSRPAQQKKSGLRQKNGLNSA